MAGLDFRRHDRNVSPRAGNGDVEVEPRGALAVGAESLDVTGEQTFEDDNFVELFSFRLVNCHHGNTLLGTGGSRELIFYDCGRQQGSGVVVAAIGAPRLREFRFNLGAAP